MKWLPIIGITALILLAVWLIMLDITVLYMLFMGV